MGCKNMSSRTRTQALSTCCSLTLWLPTPSAARDASDVRETERRARRRILRVCSLLSKNRISRHPTPASRYIFSPRTLQTHSPGEHSVTQTHTLLCVCRYILGDENVHKDLNTHTHARRSTTIDCVLTQCNVHAWQIHRQPAVVRERGIGAWPGDLL